MEVLHPRCAGLDVHKETVVACVRVVLDGEVRRTVRSFATTTAGLVELGEWLEAEGCTQVAMEATGVCWKPVWQVLSDGPFQLVLANAAHVKNVPGRKTDVNDATWLAELLAHGLIRASFVPPAAIQELRGLLRTRKQLVREKASHVQRLQKTLEEANIKLESVLSDVMGRSGRAMLQALIDGETDPAALAALAHRKVRAPEATLREALSGRVKRHHRFLLRLHLQQIDALEASVAEIDQEVAGAQPWHRMYRGRGPCGGGPRRCVCQRGGSLRRDHGDAGPDVLCREAPDCRAGAATSLARHGAGGPVRRRWRADVLRAELAAALSPCRLVRRPHPQRSQSSRPAGPAADRVRAGRERGNRQGPRHQLSALHPGAGRPGYRVTGLVRTMSNLLGGALVSLGVVVVAGAAEQSSTERGTHRVGVLSVATPAIMAGYLKALRAGLLEVGRKPEEVVIDERYALDDYEQLPRIAEDLARDGARVLITLGDTATNAAACSASRRDPQFTICG